MKIISHRGNLTGIEPKMENNPERIKDILINHLDLDIEIDIWANDDGGGFKLGHDKPKYTITNKDIDLYHDFRDRIWFHAKNFFALDELQFQGFNVFWHENDMIAMTSKGYFWNHVNNQNPLLTEGNSVYLYFGNKKMDSNKFYDLILKKIYGVCVDNCLVYQ